MDCALCFVQAVLESERPPKTWLRRAKRAYCGKGAITGKHCCGARNLVRRATAVCRKGMKRALPADSSHPPRPAHGDAQNQGRRRANERLPVPPPTHPRTHPPIPPIPPTQRPLASWQGTALFGTALFAGCAVLFCVPAFYVRSGLVIAGDKQKESADHILALDVNAIQRKTDAARPSNAATTKPPASR